MKLYFKSLSHEDSHMLVKTAIKATLREWKLAEVNKNAAARRTAAKLAAAQKTADRKERQTAAAKKAQQIRSTWVQKAQDAEITRLANVLKIVAAAGNDEAATKAALMAIVQAKFFTAKNKQLTKTAAEYFDGVYNKLLEDFSFSDEPEIAVGDQYAYSPATYQDYKRVLQRKETFTMESIVLVWYTKKNKAGSEIDTEMIEKATPVDKANNILRRKIAAPKNWYYQKFTEEFGTLGKGSLYYNTKRGLQVKPVDDLCKNIIQIDGGGAKELNENKKSFYSRLLIGGVVLRINFLAEKPEGWLENGQPDFFYYYDVDKDVFARLDSEIILSNQSKIGNKGDVALSKKNRDNGMILTTEEIQILVESENVDVKFYRPANRSTSSSRQQKGLWIEEFDPNDEKHYQKFQELLNEATCGGFVRQLKKLTGKSISRSKVVKLLERDILELTDAHVYNKEGRIHTFAIYNDAWRWTDPTTGKLSEAYDGHFSVHKRVMEGVYKEAFEVNILNIDEMLGRLFQCRAGYIKGEADLVNDLGMIVMIENLLTGKCSNGQIPKVYLLQGKEAFDSFDFEADENKNALIFTGEFEGVLPDSENGEVHDPTKIRKLAAQTDLYTDRNALKDIFDLYKAQHLSLMAFPPDDSKWVKLSNQTLFSLLLHAGYMDKKTGQYITGEEVAFTMFKNMVNRKLDDLVTEKQSFRISDFANIDVFADDAVKAIWPIAYWRDRFMHANGFAQLCRSLSRTIDHFGFEVEGFNAIGNVDPGLITAGVSLLRPGEMFSGRVKNGRRRTAVVRHPKSGENAVSILWDVSLTTMVTRMTALEANGEITHDQFKVLFDKLKNLSGRQAIVPTICSAFTNRHDGSDSDGDSYTFITQWQVVKALECVLQAAVDYGHGIPDGTMVEFSWDAKEGYVNFDTLYIELLENINHDAGDNINFLGRIISLISSLENDGMTEFEVKTLIAMFAAAVTEYPECIMFRNPGKPDYDRQFFNGVTNDSLESERTVKIDGDTVKEWVEYCKQCSVHDAKTLLAWAYDMQYILASVNGRTLDSPKTGEVVPVPFYGIKKTMYSAFGKGRKFLTSISLEYIPEEVDENGETVAKEDFEYGYLQPGFYDEKGDLVNFEDKNHKNPDYYIINDIALELKNRCLEFLVGDDGVLYEFRDAISAIKSAPMLPDIQAQVDWAIENGDLGMFSAATDFGRIHSSLSYYRPEEMKNIKPYTTGALRSMVNITDRSWADTLGLAYAASYRGWDKPVYENNIVDDDNDNDEEEKEEKPVISRVRSNYSRYYTAFGPELCRMAIEERAAEHPDFNPELKEKLVSTDGNYLFETGTKLTFENGIAKDRGTYILCGNINGNFVVTCENGVPYIKELVVDYLDRLSEDDDSHFIVNLRQPAAGYDKKGMIEAIIDFMAQPVYENYEILTISNNQTYNWICAVNKNNSHDILLFGSIEISSTGWKINGYGNEEVGRNINGVPFNSYAENVQNAQRAVLNYKIWKIKTALYSQSASGYESGILALDYVRDADELTYYNDQDFGYEMEGGFKVYQRFEDLI